MSKIVVVQDVCKICGASVSQMVEANPNGATLLFDHMPKHLEWHQAIEKELK